MNTVKVSVVQAGTFLFDTSKTFHKAKTLIEQAADRKAKLVVFPEAFLGGYPKGIDFGTRIGSRSPEGREDFLRYYRSAIEVPVKEADALGELAARHKIHLAIGIVERGGGTLYCTVLFFGPEGTLLGKHRKIMPTAMERVVWGYGDGSTMPSIRTELGTLGAAICWENYMPLFRAAMYSKGVTLWCAPTVDDRESWQVTMKHIALEGRCFVLSACQYLPRSQCPQNYHAIQGDSRETV